MAQDGWVEGDAELIEAYKAYQRTYLALRDLPATLALFDGQITGFGSSPDEFATDRLAAERLYGRDIGQVANPVIVDRDLLVARRLGADFGTVMERFSLTVDTPEGRLIVPGLRGSYAFVRRDGAWKLAHFHVSEAMARVSGAESWPLEALKERNEELERLVAARTAELETALAEKATLLKEVHHRIKNNMAAISAILDLHAYDHPGEIEEELREASGRVVSMMTLYDLLYRKESYRDLGVREYIGTLLAGLGETLGRDRAIRVERGITDLLLPVDDIFRIGITINELVTNAYKYAFEGRLSGLIRITFEGEGPSSWRLEVRDDGVGLVREPGESPRGFGMNLVSVMAKQLGAVLTIGEAPGGGVRVTLAKMVLPNAASDPSSGQPRGEARNQEP